MGIVKVKDGVTFSTIAPGGFEILRAITMVAKQFPNDLTITSGTDGMHSGISDPHHRGEAYDIRSQDLPLDVKNQVLALIQKLLGPKFYAFLESPGTSNEHIHAQVAKGQTYP